jgi:hypothetical protein
MKTFKLGLDFHGVIDTFPEYMALFSQLLVDADYEVHVVTGLKRDSGIEADLNRFGIKFTHYFSIVDKLEQDGVTIIWRDGLPYADKIYWDIAKRDYCEANQIDIMIDDSPVYRDTFHDISTVYLHLINEKRKQYIVR